ncbi:MAG: HAD family hydrolase [Cyanobacteria bacterium J06560_2]
MATVCCLGHRFESVQAVLFDKDGTLANVEGYLSDLGFLRSRLIAAHTPPDQAPTIQSAIQAAFGLSATRLDPAGLLAVGSRYDNEIAAAACLSAVGWGWVDSVRVARLAFVEAEAQLAPKASRTPPLPEAVQLLCRLTLAGIAVGIVSSDLHSEVGAFIDYYQLTDVVWHCGFPDEQPSPTVLPKTHPDFLGFACKSMAVYPSQTLVIGDSAADYSLAGCGSAGFLGMVGGWLEPPTISPEAILFSDLSQVEAFI